MKNYATLAALQADLDAGVLSLAEVVRYYLNQIEQNKQLNAFLEVFGEEAIERAKALSKKESKGKLYGLVIGIKDNICYANHTVSASSKMLEHFTSLFSATVVERLLAEDAIIIGRLNCDEFAMGGSNENSAFGAVKNAQDHTRVSGGSSGGSAVAVQANLCHATLGSDTGGSIRQPASFCNVVGIKPSYGRVSRHGLIAFASSFDQIGPITKSIDDAKIILEVINGKDHFDSTAIQNKAEHYTLNNNKTYKIAYFKQCIGSKGLDSKVKNHFNHLIETLKEKGHKVEAVEFPLLDYVIPTYYVLTTAEASSNLSRYDGVHYGYRSPNAKNMEEVYTMSRTEGFGKEVKNRIMLGTFVLSAGYYDAYYTKAQKVRKMLKNAVDELYKNYDFILSPTAPTPAFKLGEKNQDPVTMYLEDIFTVLANLVGNPAISLPLYKNNEGLGIGMQFMANNNIQALCEGRISPVRYSSLAQTELNEKIRGFFSKLYSGGFFNLKIVKDTIGADLQNHYKDFAKVNDLPCC
ncbi:MAG: Asp-tRNA(Asn)/Glu-tRNA(Gln) amidotransferase subunit GatA, partial [Chitinophagales bacterium]|nr:Asp-tRNA(Asn)/Glu-tRNA(Gln) amidotransferase subunit GatA [Chitinophagales bacterium]